MTRGGHEKIKGRSLHTEKVPEAGEAHGRRGRQTPELIGILDHSTRTVEFSTLRTIKGL